jgi:hypothetical protein
MSVSIGLMAVLGSESDGKKSSDFLHVAGLEMETEIWSIVEVHQDSDHKEVCVDIYWQVGVNGAAISSLAGWLLGKDRTEYALWHSGLSAIKSHYFITGEIGKRGEIGERTFPRGIPTTPVDQAGPKERLQLCLSVLTKRNRAFHVETGKSRVMQTLTAPSV